MHIAGIPRARVTARFAVMIVMYCWLHPVQSPRLSSWFVKAVAFSRSQAMVGDVTFSSFEWRLLWLTCRVGYLGESSSSWKILLIWFDSWVWFFLRL